MHNQQNNQQLNEGLRATDLKEMVHDIFEVDSFRSKMGEDQDVCVVSFKVKDRSPAKDLMEFIEKGYEFVLDADVSSGEDNNGEYSVFVEISRTPKLAEHIRVVGLTSPQFGQGFHDGTADFYGCRGSEE